MDTRKGVAVSQIILLVLGILVLAVVAYLLYTNFVTSGGTITAEQCRAAATRACTACSIANLGSTTNCPAANYLAANPGGACINQGFILGSGLVSQSTTDQSTGKTTWTITGGTIDCAQYVGGQESGAGGGGGGGVTCNNDGFCDPGEREAGCLANDCK